jgi:hypothetical protein
VRERVAEVARLLSPYARGDRVRAAMCLEPALAGDHAFAHSCLTRLGYPDVDLDRLLFQCSTAKAAAGHERLPHRRLEQEWLTRAWDPAHTVSCPDRRLPARSALGAPMDALSSSRDDVYAFTHALMFLTDLGSSHPQLPRPGSAIAADAEAALARCLDEQDYDLCGEVLLTWPLLHRHWSPAAIFGFRVLAGVEDDAGFLPAPIIRLERFQALRGEERSCYALATAYHTVYVMGLLCAVALIPGCAPPVRVPASRRSRGAAAAMLEFIDENGRELHWRDWLARLPPCEQDALASMIFTICLRRAVTHRDLRLTHRALHLGARYSLLSVPAAQQAVELLQRALTLEGLKRPVALSGAEGVGTGAP